MVPIRLLALDVDDTLLRSDLSISYRTRSAVKRAAAQGVTLALASGRVPEALDKISAALGMQKRPDYLICNNGTLIQESDTGRVIFEKRLESRVALIACDLAAAEGFPVQLYEDDIMYVSQRNEFSEYDQKTTGLRQVVVENFRDMVGQGCYKLLIPGDPMLLAPLESLLRVYLGEEATLFTSRPYYLEILPAKTDKGTALAFVAEKLGIGRDEVMAVGDSMNDEGMLRWAGRSVVMANGDKRMKALASLVTDRTNDDDGVADLIEEYILKKGRQSLGESA